MGREDSVDMDAADAPGTCRRQEGDDTCRDAVGIAVEGESPFRQAPMLLADGKNDETVDSVRMD